MLSLMSIIGYQKFVRSMRFFDIVFEKSVVLQRKSNHHEENLFDFGYCRNHGCLRSAGRQDGTAAS